MIEITKFTRKESGHFLGFVDVAVPGWDTMVNIRDCRAFQKDVRMWVNLPSSEYTKQDGSKGYYTLIGLDDDAIYKRMTNAMSAAFTEYMQTQQPQAQPDYPVPDVEPAGVPF